MSTELGVIRRLYRYNARVRRKYLRAIWGLPKRTRLKDEGASFPSVVDIYMHVLDAYRWWFLTVYRKRTDVVEYPVGGQRYGLTKAKKETDEVEREVNMVLNSIREGDLSRRITIPGGKGSSLPLRVLLLHMVEEELQHRGEMNALLWRAGREPPVTGFDDWPRPPRRGATARCPEARSEHHRVRSVECADHSPDRIRP